MVDLYYRLVKEDKRTIEEVPEKYRAEVQAKLDAEAVI
ncbi:ASCH domain-containing protein [Fictibacillus sp. 7GRE50]|nr:CD1375 family protein [Fictibacillus sp. 7GRE50]MBH0166284.1 ASCH domain-containing protein [Fictibacillus sp. 7GRE50]